MFSNQYQNLRADFFINSKKEQSNRNNVIALCVNTFTSRKKKTKTRL